MEEVAAAMLPDDLLLEILARVTDVAALFRCATACKRWCRQVVDPSFLRRRWPDQDSASSSFVGFFTPQHNYGEGRVTVQELCFVPTPQSALGPGRRGLSSFMTATTAGLFDKAVPLASRHGLLLVLLEANETDGYPDLRIVHLQLAVCDLFIGTCRMLPPLKYPSIMGNTELSGYAILTGADCFSNDESSPSVIPNNSCFFKVVIVTTNYQDIAYGIHTFSSDKGSWKAHTNCIGGTVHVENYGLFGDAVVRRGTVHWQFSGEPCLSIINMDIQTDHISLTRLPFLQFPSDNRLTSHNSLTLGVNGMLSLLLIQNACLKIEIWEQEDRRNADGANSTWLCTRTIDVKQPWETTKGRKLRVMGEKCGTVLVHDSCKHVYTVDLGKGRMEALDWSCNSYTVPWKIVPVAMDWSRIFISRLHGKYS